MKRIALISIVLLATVALLAGVGWAKTPIRMVTYGDSSSTARYQKIADAFNSSHPEYELRVEIYPYAEYPTKMTVMMAAGSPPDVFMTWAQYKALWAEQGLLKDLGSYWERSSIARGVKIFPFMMDAAIYKGRTYGVPYDYSSMAMVLNMNALNSSGLPEPTNKWTVDDFKKYAIRLTRPQEGFYGMQSAGHWSTNNWQWSVIFTGQGWLNESRTDVLVERPEYINMLEFWYDLMHTYNAVPVIGKAPSRDTWSGGYGMWQGYVHYGARLDSGPYDWSMVTFPQGAGGQNSFAQGHMWSIPSNASKPELGWAVLEWFLSPEGQRVIVEDGRQPLTPSPALWNLFFSNVSPAKRDKLQKLVMDVLYGNNLIHNMNYWTTWPDVDRIMNKQLQSVFQRTAAPSTAMAQAAKEIRALLK